MPESRINLLSTFLRVPSTSWLAVNRLVRALSFTLSTVIFLVASAILRWGSSPLCCNVSNNLWKNWTINTIKFRNEAAWSKPEVRITAYKWYGITVHMYTKLWENTKIVQAKSKWTKWKRTSKKIFNKKLTLNSWTLASCCSIWSTNLCFALSHVSACPSQSSCFSLYSW